MTIDLSSLTARMRTLPEYANLIDDLRRQAEAPVAVPIVRDARPMLAAALASDLQRPVVYVAPRADRMLELIEELPYWAPDLPVYPFPEPTTLPYEVSPWGPRARLQRAALLGRLQPPNFDPGTQNGPPEIILTTSRALMVRSISPATLRDRCRWLSLNSEHPLETLLNQLVGIGYTHESVVSSPGQFSRRGGILDVWPPNELHPIRIEFFGDSIDSLRRFDPTTQLSQEQSESVLVAPAREGLPVLLDPAWAQFLPHDAVAEESVSESTAYLEWFLGWMEPEPYGLLDHLPQHAQVLLEDESLLHTVLDDLESQAVELRQELESRGQLPASAPLPYITRGELSERLQQMGSINLGLTSAETLNDSPLGERFAAGPRFGGQLSALLKYLGGRQMAHEATVVVSRQASRLAEVWSESERKTAAGESVPDDLVPGEVVFLQGALAGGWLLDLPGGGKLNLLTDSEVFGWSRPQPRRRRRRAAGPEANFADLRPGSIVAHTDYGLGRFVSLVERTIGDLRREYLLLEYAGGSQVYVPVHQADRVSRYIGVDGREPKLSRLAGGEWRRARQQAMEAVEDVAADLLQLYAERSTVSGHPYSPDGAWQHELEASFPYVETDDQIQAIAAVKADMQSTQPMDRLICGDVGYGKTEVALRAAFKAVMDNRQVALLVPTTILAQQHFNTFKLRLSAFPVSVDMLSRFRSPAETRDVLGRLQSGEVDIVIGTHRLLQPDVKFHDLGLLIIDEEQRFGVTHKETLKQMRTSIDVLTMTATPIPRTLYMALSGVRDISTIDTPPEERLPIITHVGAYDPRLVRQAILREIDRGGQVFFVHNRVQTIERARSRLARLMPEASIEIAHGQLPEAELAQVMERYAAGEVDVLVCTSIIESGLDIPNANTLIIDRADQFGLAQLYQLRGRVGRGPSRGYAYFFRQSHRQTTEEALKRLEVIAEHSQLGAGYAISLRDLEIRGAGDLLGTRQSGHIAAVGFHLYTRLLAAAVRRQRSQHRYAPAAGGSLPQVEPELNVSVELPLASALPPDYVPDRGLRLQLYRRMAEMRQLDSIDGFREELSDRFGPPPAEVDNLLYQMKIKLLAHEAAIETVTTENNNILLQGPQVDDLPLNAFGDDLRRSRRGIWLRSNPDVDWQQRLLQVLAAMGEAHAARLQIAAATEP